MFTRIYIHISVWVSPRCCPLSSCRGGRRHGGLPRWGCSQQRTDLPSPSASSPACLEWQVSTPTSTPSSALSSSPRWSRTWPWSSCWRGHWRCRQSRPPGPSRGWCCQPDQTCPPGTWQEAGGDYCIRVTTQSPPSDGHGGADHLTVVLEAGQLPIRQPGLDAGKLVPCQSLVDVSHTWHESVLLCVCPPPPPPPPPPALSPLTCMSQDEPRGLCPSPCVEVWQLDVRHDPPVLPQQVFYQSRRLWTFIMLYSFLSHWMRLELENMPPALCPFSPFTTKIHFNSIS